jgi:hypothetical protein
MACTSCVNTCLCAVVAGDSSITVAGSGSGADPYRITATPTATPINCEEVQDCVGGMLDTVGFSYDDSNGRFQPTSGTVGQALLITGPGTANWGTPAGGGGGGGVSSVSVTDTSSVNLTVTNPTGPSVDISAAVITGCGLVSDATGVRVNTSATSLLSAGFGCADTNGAPIYCSAAGTLRTLPPSMAVSLERLTATVSGTVAPGATGTQATINRIITNPSPCRSAAVHLNLVQRWRSGFQFSSGSNDMAARGSVLATIGGGALAGPFTLSEWNPSYGRGLTTPNVADRGAFNFAGMITDSFVLAPGASFGYGYGVNIHNDSTVGPVTSFNYVIGAEAAGILVTL